MNKFYFVLFTIFLYCIVGAQQILVTGPGGVPGTVLWMKTVPASKDFQGPYLWKDFSGDSLRVTYYNTSNEYIVDRQYFGRAYNFNNAIAFTNPSLSKEIEVRSGNLSTATIIGAFAESGKPGEYFSDPSYIMTINGEKGKGFVLNKDKIINSKESNRGVLDYGSEEGYDLTYHHGKSPEPDLNSFKERTLRSFTYYRTNKPNTSLWGERRSANISLGEKFYLNNINNNSTYDTELFNPNSIFYGYIPELFIYDRLLTPLERIKTESYLALKYGFMLERSFIGSNNQLLWDIDQEKKYNHRVTGIYRDDKSGLYQKRSSTSYEEAPYFSYLPEGDSYDNATNYSLSNKNKLLVIERYPTNTLENSDYMIWGDNNQTVKTKKLEEFLGMKIMDRQWMLKTNMGNRMPNPDGIEWEISSNLEVIKNDYKLSSIKKVNTLQKGVLSSKLPLPGYDGQISFILTAPLASTIVKFGTKNVPEENGSNDYGIFINEKGELYPIIKGYPQWNSKWKYNLKQGDQVRIDKTKEFLIVNVNGNFTPQTGQSLPQIFFNKEDIEKDFYVSLGLYDQNINPTIKDFRVGGFTETGNRIELSYSNYRATDFSKYASNGQSYILIDRSGTGEFKKENTDIYPSDEYDSYRNKIVFNNIFFDTDYNGKDIFTFGYRESNLIANVEKTNPICDNSGNPVKNGSIDVEIVRGDEGFEYQLINKEDSQIKKSGVFYGKNLKIDSLDKGEYTLKLKEIGGFNILPVQDSNQQIMKAGSYQSIDWDRGGMLETTLKDLNQDFQIGLCLNSDLLNVSNSILQYGFEVKQGRVYLIIDKVKNQVPVEGINLKVGDKIQVYRDYQREVPYRVYYRINGVPFYTQKVSQYRGFIIQPSNKQTGIYNVKNTIDGVNWISPSEWVFQGVYSNPKSMTFSASTTEHTIILEADCNKENDTENDTDLIIQTKEQNNLTTYYKNFSNQSEITAYVKLNDPSPLSIGIFNFSGNMVYYKEIKESKKEHTIDISGLYKGVYILKVFSSEGEFTKKITIN